jgi:DNA-cytosine methyltransferase
LRPRFTYVELFAGIGGFRLALDAIGGACVFASELCREARQTYHANFGPTPDALAGDITEVDACDIPPFDVLTGGFPCQSFSQAGEQRGLQDDRGKLFFEIVRLLRQCNPKPKAFLLENVPAIIDIDGGKTMQVVLSELRAAGFEVSWRVLNSRAYVPQSRERVFFVGVRRNLLEAAGFHADAGVNLSFAEVSCCDRIDSKIPFFAWPEPPAGPPPTLRDILEDYVGSPEVDKFCPDDADARAVRLQARLNAHALTARQWAKIIERNRARSKAKVERGDRSASGSWRIVDVDGAARTLSAHYRKGYLLHSEFVRRPAAGAVENKGNESKTAGANRVARDELPLETWAALKARIGASMTLRFESMTDAQKSAVRAWHSLREARGPQLPSHAPRFFTARECARIQGFPDDFVLDACERTATGRRKGEGKGKGGSRRANGNRVYHQLGNSVSPPLVRAVAASLFNFLEDLESAAAQQLERAFT